jgi:thymidylate synthase (FAD)
MYNYDLQPSVSQESMRYVDQDSAEYICPSSIGNNVNRSKLFKAHMQQAWALYHRYRQAGVKKEDARYVLPIAAASRLVLTMNFRSWLHFCKVRCHPSAQWEIRAVATEILRQLHEQAPAVFGDLWHNV